MTRSEAALLQEVVAAAVESLFVSGVGKRASRLALLDDDNRDLGGWGLEPASQHVLKLLTKTMELMVSATANSTAAKQIGTVYDRDSLFMRVKVGDAKSGEDVLYELSSSLNGLPIISSPQTGKAFSVSWEELLELARAAGIDSAEEPAGG